MNSAINLDNYFERIGYGGSATVSVQTLQALHEKHTQSIPFENLNPLLGKEVKLDTNSLEQKMILRKRGGYCFEQNLLFREVLRSLGFQAKGLTAHIRWKKSEDEITARSHMLLQVEIDGKDYLADVGFGNNTLTGPLLLKPDKVQETPHEPRRLKRQGKEFIMQTLIDDKWEDLYQFDLKENYLPDYEITNWYLSHHPESHFVTGLIAARPEPGRRYVLHNNRLAVHHLNGETVKQKLKTAGEIREILEDKFLLSLPGKANLDQKLSQLIRAENR